MNSSSLDSLDLTHVVHLVESLYSSKDPQQVLQIQKELQLLQKSAIGWDIANLLLSVDSSLNCNFFGALTYTVNINTHVNELTQERAAQIINELLGHTVNSIRHPRGNMAFLVRKLLSNLALMFNFFFENWQYPLTSIAISLNNGSPVIVTTSQEFPQISEGFIEVIILFSQIIVEEALRKETPSKNTDFFKIVHDNLFPLTSHLLFTNNLFIQSLECLNSWIQYVSTAEYKSLERYDLHSCLSQLLDLVVHKDNSISSRAMEVTVETLETKPAFFNKTLKTKIDSIIFSTWSIDFINNSKENDDFDSINCFSRLVTTYLETDVIYFATSLLNSDTATKFEFLMSLTDFPAAPIDEELISKDFLEFWSELGEAYIDDEERLATILKNDENKILQLNQKATDLFSNICYIYWKKIHIPKHDFTSYRTQFLSYRRDVADFFDLVYPIVKFHWYKASLDDTIARISNFKNDESLESIEASLYVLNAISMNFTENNINPEILQCLCNLLDNQLLQLLISQINREGVTYSINTLIQFLSGIDFFYKNEIGLQYIPSILDFLFNCIIQSPSYRLSASKAIAKISDDCRLSLVSYLPNFENILMEMINNENVDNIVRERITNSYASIIQGTKDPEIQGNNLSILLKIFDLRIETIVASENIAQHLEYLISLLNCVSEVGKGMQLPDDIEEFYTPEETSKMNDYWSRDPFGIHNSILSIISKASLSDSQPLLLSNSEILDKCCLILKKGLTESTEGPFVIKSDDIVKFVVSKFPRCSQDALPNLFQLLESLVCANYMKLSDELIYQALNVILFQAVDVIKSDPDLMESSISMMGIIVEKKPSLVIFNEEFPKILDLCLDGVKTKEKFILKASSRFWSRVIVLKKGDKRDHDHISHLFIDQNLGLILSHNTLESLLVSLRSNIEYYQEVLKFLVVKYPLQSNTWFNLSFQEISKLRELQNLKPLNRPDLFVKKLMATRGKGHQFMEVVKGFWLEANGLTNY